MEYWQILSSIILIHKRSTQIGGIKLATNPLQKTIIIDDICNHNEVPPSHRQIINHILIPFVLGINLSKGSENGHPPIPVTRPRSMSSANSTQSNIVTSLMEDTATPKWLKVFLCVLKISTLTNDDVVKNYEWITDHLLDIIKDYDNNPSLYEDSAIDIKSLTIDEFRRVVEIMVKNTPSAPEKVFTMTSGCKSMQQTTLPLVFTLD